MRRLILFAAMSMVAALVLASAAMAQDNPNCPEGGFPAAPQGAQQGGGGDLLCFPTQEAADTYNSTGEIPPGVAGEAYNPTTGQVVNPDAVPCDQVLRPEGAAGGPAPVAVEREFGTERTQECLAEREAQQQDPGMPNSGMETPGTEAGNDQYEDGGMQPPATGGGMQELPDTGGPALLPLAGVMLVIGGALGFVGLWRRS